MGTSFSVTAARRLIPPRKIKPQMTTRIRPTTKSCLAGRSNGVRLYHAAKKAQCQGNCNCEKASQKFSQRALKGSCYVINRTAVDIAVFINDTCFLSKSGLCINRSHTKECNHPHPKNSTRAAGQNCTRCADDISGSHLSRDSSCQRLKRAHSGFMFFSIQRQIAKYMVHSFAKVSNLNKTGFDGVAQSDCNQHDKQNVIGKVAVDCLHDR